MGANFTPSWNTYKDLKPFRFWCQKVLPTVYDDSLSYYELLCKVVNYLNVVIENLEGVEQNTDALLNAFNQLQGYVNEYFEDVLPQLVDDKIDELVTNGTFDTIVNNILQPYYAEMEQWKQQVEDDLEDDFNDYTTGLNQRMDDFEGAVDEDIARAQAAADSASDFADESEAWARGTVNGTPVSSTDAQYQNNSKYYAELAAQAAANATYANEAQAWANGAVNGTPVDSSAPQYENNAKYYAELAAQAAANATYANEAQAWATGEVNGTPVASTDAQYQNNAKYYAQQAASAATTAATAAANAAVSTALAPVTAEIADIKDKAWKNFFAVTVSTGVVNKVRTNGGTNIPGLFEFWITNYPDNTTLDDWDDFEYREGAWKMVAVDTTGLHSSTTGQWILYPLNLSLGYDNGHKIFGVQVWDLGTGAWAADGTTVSQFNAYFTNFVGYSYSDHGGQPMHSS